MVTHYEEGVELSPHRLTECEAILRSHPIFTSLSPSFIRDLAALFILEHYQKDQVIVKQEDFVDSFFFILDGFVEVHLEYSSKVNDAAPIAILKKGEAIGLSETGFFSSTGRRTATVIAAVPVTVARLDIGKFSDYMDDHPELDQVFLGESQHMLEMNFIKQVIPFSELSSEKISYLVKQVKVKTIKKNEYVFHQGDTGDSCYLVQRGKIGIFVEKNDKGETLIAELGKSSVFGETAILTHTSRNASAKALEATELLVIKSSLLQEVLEADHNTRESFDRLIALRMRPQRIEGIEHYTVKASDGEEFIILKNANESKYFRLTKEGWFVWQHLTGDHSTRDITLQLFYKYNYFDPEFVSNLIAQLKENGFLIFDESELKKTDKNLAGWAKSILKFRNIMEARCIIKNVDEWVTKTYEKGVSYLFSKVSLFLVGVISLLGIGSFVMQFSKSMALMQITNGSGWLLIITIPFVMVTFILHELAHAYTTKMYGKKIYGFGVGWLWIGPIAFCDTSDMWLSPPRQRLMVDIAGFCVQFFVAGLSASIALFVSNPHLSLMLWYFSLFNYLIIFANLNPLIELDGYYLLLDLFDSANLKESSVKWIMSLLEDKGKNKVFSKPACIYWMICLLYLVLSFIVSYWVTTHLLIGFFGVKKPLISLAISSAVLILSSLSIVAELKKFHSRKSPSQ